MQKQSRSPHVPYLYRGWRLRLNWYRSLDPVWVSFIASGAMFLAEVFLWRRTRSFFQGLLKEGAVGCLGANREASSEEGDDGRATDTEFSAWCGQRG